MASLISQRSLAPSLPLFFLLLSTAFSQSGKELYLRHCSSCHHEKRIGRTAPPLLPEFLRRKSSEKLFRIIKEGIPSSSMPSFRSLSEEDIRKIISYIRSPVFKVRFTLRDVKESYTLIRREEKRISIDNVKNLTVAVDKGGRVWVLEGKKILDSFTFKNVHGGVKFSPDGKRFYVPSRDGWVLFYDLKRGKPVAKIRACVYLRNIALSPDGELLAVSCVLPKKLILLSKDLRVLKSLNLPGRPSAIYELTKKNIFVLTFRDKPFVAFLNMEGDLSLKKIEEPLEDFFIDPFEKYLIGSNRVDRKIVVYEIESLRKVYEREISGLPHLFSSTFWYRGGKFFFATRHVSSTEVSIWRMYDWELVREVDTGGKGFFVRTHPDTPYLWVDNGKDGLVLIDKRDLHTRKVRFEGKVTHVEFSGDGRLAYLSLLGKKGKILIVDSATLKPVSEIPAIHPAGKYNYVLKSRRFYRSLLGREVFMEKCWGCHHPTHEAFGPSFKWIASHRSEGEIISQILNPEETSKLLGYERNVMPKFDLSPEEIEVLLSYIESFRSEEVKYAEH